MLATQDDHTVIQQVLKGQTTAYSVLVERYQSFVFTLALRYVPNREVAEELAQDIFVKAFRCLADFKGNSKFSTWLYTIVNTTCISYLRKKQDKAILPGDEKITAFADSTHGQLPARHAEQRTLKHMITSAMNQLPPDEARILTLFYLAELSVSETGTILGLTETNTKVRLLRARQKLKQVLETQYARELDY